MIKVNYNEEGRIMGFYPDTVKYAEIPTPYIEINESEYKEIFPNMSKYRVVDGKFKDISNSDDYVYEQSVYAKSREIFALKNEINLIETSQHRALREYILNPCDETKERISDIDERICALRTQLQNIQL